MKKIFIALILIFLSHGVIFAVDLSCYKKIVNIQPKGTSSLLLENKNSDFRVTQDGMEIIDIKDVTQAYQYIPFITDIKKNGSQTLFTIDTEENKTINITVDNLSTYNFKLNFQHDAKYHTPKYYISEDSETYSQVTDRNISDFQIYKLRIIFEKSTSEEIREIINIDELSIERVQKVFSITPNNESEIIIYSESPICGETFRQFLGGEKEIEGIPIYQNLTWRENILYTKKTTDSDKDSIMDLYDNCKSVKNRDQKDINQNGVGDACEFDSDNDGVPDEIDNCRNIANVDQADDDYDGIGNSCDNCKLYNPSQKDTDGNKIGDTCDQQKIFLQNNDDDQDGILNALDNCEFISNPDQADDDNDGVGNSCDNCKLFQNYDQTDKNKNGIGDICEDSDSDGVDSITDNCINIANPDQADDDNDGIGNVCEDDDRDTVLFSLDNCPYDYNPKQIDSDNDGMGDVCDQDDDRFLESNKEIFIFLMFLIMAGFGGAIFMMAKKLKK